MMYAFVFLLIVSVVFLLRLEKHQEWRKENKEKIYPSITAEETKLLSEMSDRIGIVETYYLQTFIGEKRMRDEEWMRNNSKPGDSVPLWRLYQITRTPETKEGMIFKNRIDDFTQRYERIKKDRTGSRVNNYVRFNELCALNNEIEELFPEAFVSIKREEKLKDLGI